MTTPAEPRWPYAVSFAAGLVICLLITAWSGRREAWDSPLYFALGMPLMCALIFAVAYQAPRRVWRWVLAMVLAGGSASLWPLALIAMTVLSLPQWIVARLASRWRLSRDGVPPA